jgi:hypothetical protein
LRAAALLIERLGSSDYGAARAAPGKSEGLQRLRQKMHLESEKSIYILGYQEQLKIILPQVAHSRRCFHDRKLN